ncbi:MULTISPECIES: relaxase/mobilization nuclease domain-containing protein [unclassified Streptomyces]|uniref:relaxase/mobilization nuclease domain-containing protein n=1 Tax=unclassified Streptomyces TaxID=2593676 RepID=UPI0035E10745
MKRARDGQRTSGLLHYLYGPGKKDEHTNQHMVAAWMDGVPDPGRDKGASIPYLAALLDAPVLGLESTPPAKYVYHMPVRLAPEDRTLSDAEWAEIAGELMHAVGIAEKGDPMGARWVAIRHADDHIHIVATLARQDGMKVPLSFDKRKMQEKAKELEIRFGLRRLDRGDKTAGRWPTTAEAEKAKRKGRDEPPRVTLQGKVRQAAAAAGSDDEFFAAIQRAGIRLNKRTAPDGAVTGYSVALPGDRTGAGRAVWFSGSRLAPDLSLPRVRERWTGVPTTAGVVGAGQVTSQAAAWQAAAWQVHQASAVLGQVGDEASAGEVSALSDFLATYADQAPAEVRQELRQAAQAFERAGRAPMSRQMHSEASSHFRMATQLVLMGATLGASGGEAAAAITVLVAIALAVIAAQRLHQAAQHRAQEEAAARAGFHLRAATEVAYGARAGQESGRSNRSVWEQPATQLLNGSVLAETYAPVVRAAVPGAAERVLREEAWPALAATLKQAQNAGYDPAGILAEVAMQRGFGDAESVAEVLVWRLQRRMVTDTSGASGGSASPVRADPAQVGLSSPDVAGENPPDSDAPTGTGITSEGPAGPSPVVGHSESIAAIPLSGEGSLTFGEAVRQAVPVYADQVLADPAAATLAAYLVQASGEGYIPAELLGEVAASRDLADADSVAQVLAWRLRGRLSSAGNLVFLSRSAGRRANPVGPQGANPGERSAADRAAQEAAQRRAAARGPRR